MLNANIHAQCSLYIPNLTSAVFILIVLWYILLYLSILLSNLSIYTFFWYWSYIFVDFTLQSSNNSFSNNTDSPPLCIITFLYFYLATKISLICYKISYLYLPIFCLACILTHSILFGKYQWFQYLFCLLK